MFAECFPYFKHGSVDRYYGIQSNHINTFAVSISFFDVNALSTLSPGLQKDLRKV